MYIRNNVSHIDSLQGPQVNNPAACNGASIFIYFRSIALPPTVIHKAYIIRFGFYLPAFYGQPRMSPMAYRYIFTHPP